MGKQQIFIAEDHTILRGGLGEREVLKLIGEGYKNKEIAYELCISVKMVEKHRTNPMEKLNLHSASALTAFAIQKGFVSR